MVERAVKIMENKTNIKLNDMPYDGFYKYNSDVAKGYDQSRENERHWARENEFVRQFMEKTNAANLLDLPVGTGRFIQYYDKLSSIYGIDISDSMLSEARKKIENINDAERVNLEIGNVFKLRFDKKYFDLTVVFRLLHLIPDGDLENAISELCRVTRNQILLQTYTHSKRGIINSLAMLASLLTNTKYKRFRETKANDDSLTPWSHIRSYNHSKPFIDGLFLRNGFSHEYSEVIDVYGDLDVNVTIYVRQD